MKMQVKHVIRKTSPLFATILFAVMSMRIASAQAFSAYDSNHLELLDGFTFNINGVAQTGVSNVGTSGTYDFGFTLTGGPIHALVLSGSAFGAVGSVIAITGIDQFGLISGNASFAVSHTHDVIRDYNGNTTPANSAMVAWASANFGGGGGYAARNFGTADFLRGGSEHSLATDAEYGSYDFNVTNSSGPIYLGAHVRVGGANGVTAHVLIEDVNVVPEGSSMAMLGVGMLPILGIFLKRRKNAKR